MTINMNYGFRSNMANMFHDEELFDLVESTFANLPLIHVVKTSQGTLMGLHGGIPILETDVSKLPGIPDLTHGEIKLDSRHINIEQMDPFSQQILWNDPVEDLPEGMLYLPSRWGIGVNYGKDVFNRWTEVNEVDRVIRAHEVYQDGHREFL